MRETIFAERCRKLRTAKGMSAIQVAVRGNMSRDVVYKLEKGEHSPAFDTIVGMASALGTTTDYLVGLTDNWLPLEDGGVAAEPDVLKMALQISTLTLAERKCFGDLVKAVFGLRTMALAEHGIQAEEKEPAP